MKELTAEDLLKERQEEVIRETMSGMTGAAQEETMEYRYGMRLRGFSIGCQPKGVIAREDDTTGKYYDILVYGKKLSEKELEDYELDYIGEGSR